VIVYRTNVLLIQPGEISLKIGQYLMKLRHVKLRRAKSVPLFLGATL